MSEQALARALEARLEPERRDDPAGSPASSARGTNHDRSKLGREEESAANGAVTTPSAAEERLVDELAALAERLVALPNPPEPEADFRVALAARLAAAPSPSSVAPTAAASTSAAPVDLDSAAAPSTRELSRALDDALSRLSRGASPVLLEEGLGAAGVELAPLLDLAASLREVQEPPLPTPEFRSELASRLAAAPQPRSLRPAPASSGVGLLRRLWRSTAFTAAAAATVVLFLVAGVTYASADALPGAPLYPVKRTAERARLWLSTEAQAMALHMDYADLRLAEALAVPGRAGEALADFSREVTAALVGADAALAAGAEREAVAAPLLLWLIDARVELIAHREGLPPIAWRVALAQVDAAIAALRAGRPLSERPVPRMADPVAVLALRADATFRPIWQRAPLRPWLDVGSAAGAGDGDREAAEGEETVQSVGADDSIVGESLVARAGDGAPTDPVTASTVDPVASAPGVGAPPPAGEPVGGENPPAPTAPRSSEPAPVETKKPTRRPPTATPAPPTAQPEPPASPSPSPEPEPSQTPVPVVPTDPPVSPTPPPVVPTQAPPEPTTLPSPTATAAPVLPASIEVVCTPNTLLPAGRADCRIELADAPPAHWEVEWVASLGTIVWPHPDHSEDKRLARYEATNSLQGVEKVYATVHATLRDGAGNVVEGSTIIYIVPRLDELSLPPGDDLAPGATDG